MSGSVKRAAGGTLREEQARQTRGAVLAAARSLFERDGYAGTTMAAVAADARVSVETVYKGFGNKAKLVKAVFDVAVVGDDEPMPMVQREFIRQLQEEPDPRSKLTMYGGHIAEVHGRVGKLLLVVRDAAATNPEAAAVWSLLQQERHHGMTMFAQHLGVGGHLAVSVADAADVIWAFNSAEVWDLLHNQRGWDQTRLGVWIGQQLVAALLAPERSIKTR